MPQIKEMLCWLVVESGLQYLHSLFTQCIRFIEYTSEQIQNQLALSPQAGNQGGYLVQTYRSTEEVITEIGNRTAGTHIYYLIDESSPSDLYHLLLSDEVWHFYMGDPVKILELNNNVSGHIVETVLGDDIIAGQNITHVVERNTWFAASRVDGGPCGWSLVGTTVSPGFEFEDFQAGNRTELLSLFPEAELSIISLTLNDE